MNFSLRRTVRKAVIAACVLPVAAALVTVMARYLESRPTRLTQDGVQLEVLSKQWVHDVMQHGEGSFGTPPAMMPGMPVGGEQRLSLEIRLYNRSSTSHRFDPARLELVSNKGERREPSQLEIEEAVLRPMQA